jgi:hypothetical protein
MTNYNPDKLTNYNPSKLWSAYIARYERGAKGNLAQCLSFVSDYVRDDEGDIDPLVYVLALVNCLSKGWYLHDDFSISYDELLDEDEDDFIERHSY